MKKPRSRKLAAEIKAVRKALGLSQADLADLVGVHYMTVSTWERGIAHPSAFQLSVLRVFGEAVTREGAALAIRARYRAEGPLGALYLALMVQKGAAP